MTEQVKHLENKQVEAESRLSQLKSETQQKRQDLEEVESACERLVPLVSKCEAEEMTSREEQRRLEQDVTSAVSGYFKELSKKMGVPDAQKLEQEIRHDGEEINRRKGELTLRLGNIKAELEMLKQDEKRSPEEAERVQREVQVEIEQFTRKGSKINEQMEALEEAVKDLEKDVEKCKAAEFQEYKGITQIGQEIKDARQQLLQLEKRCKARQAEKSGAKAAREEILKQSVLEDVEIPLLRGQAEDLREVAEKDSQTFSQSQGTQGTQEAADQRQPVVVDYSKVPMEKREVAPGPASKMMEEEYKGELKRLTDEMERLSPNLKAIDQLSTVTEQVQNMSHEADTARRQIEEVDAQFETIRKERTEKFMNCFQRVQAEIDGVYKKLTANTAGLTSDGGSAFLDLDNTEVPFEGGIKFTAMPPAKRFRDMHLLSGGEKTLAAMALLFAVHAYNPPPFMVLDEVDAALDANNVQALANYVDNTECQMIVISLKDRFFHRGKSLVGVYKNKPKETSAILTLDLTKYQ
eukprot:gnl/MRDRNA2_/MRDRNA2_18127_c0_seq1.p1 gnl/MRDRNA2_/MRDRNA2_18127_c0~~gnl/MRDRNA2_/MRDRNA2_18127_c0_seq1.p1  ORF type:complete len:523 (+),score=171.57 gnl/MRDRNA2_/MRDRNA2_18127_c0_seq1:293-1861(+)